MDRQHLTTNLDRDTAISIGYKYLNGDEENGIFIDYEIGAQVPDPIAPVVFAMSP